MIDRSVTIGSRLNGRDNNFTAVRIIASTAVLFSHAFLVTIPGLQTADYPHLFGFSPGFHAVHVFFILSGFFLTMSITNSRDVVLFCVSRFLRLLPAVAVSALVIALIVGPIITSKPLSVYFGSNEPILFIASITSLFDISRPLPGVFQNNVLPGDVYELLWTLRYEIFLCACLAFAFVSGLIESRHFLAIGTVGMLIIFAHFFWNGNGDVAKDVFRHPIRFATSFVVGVAAYRFRCWIPHSPILLLLLAAFALACLPTGLAALAGILLLAYGVLFFGFAQLRWAAGINRLGLGSYGIYVFGFAVLQLVHMVRPDLGPWAVGMVAWLITVPLALLSWHFIEKPILKLRKPITAWANSAFRLQSAET